MREILFRGKKVDNNKWVYGYYVQQYGANMIYLPDGVDREYGFDYYHIIPTTIGQYTGLTDKNGKKIFEGDIVKISGDLAGVYVSVWEEYKFEYEFDNKEMSFGLCCVHSDDIEVIGNIHDNPELLAKK
jgi:uncharacterized phage protein (TIGR01671 family)